MFAFKKKHIYLKKNSKILKNIIMIKKSTNLFTNSYLFYKENFQLF